MKFVRPVFKQFKPNMLEVRLVVEPRQEVRFAMLAESRFPVDVVDVKSAMFCDAIFGAVKNC